MQPTTIKTLEHVAKILDERAAFEQNGQNYDDAERLSGEARRVRDLAETAKRESGHVVT